MMFLINQNFRQKNRFQNPDEGHDKHNSYGQNMIKIGKGRMIKLIWNN